MSIVQPPVVSIPGQVNPTSQPGTTQANFRQIWGEVSRWNPDAPIPMLKKWVNNAYRRVIDERLWYGLMLRGQVTVPQAYNTGTAAFTLGSATVTGTGTAWIVDMVGRQIRAGFSTGWYNIKSVNPATQTITLDLPWGNPSVTSGYQIIKTWVSLGYNIKMVLEIVNQRQGWRMVSGIPQAAINRWDTWRTTTGWSYALANREPTADGQPQYEIYPAPTFQQVFPFLAYTQAPDMANDDSFPAAFIRSDVLVLAAIKDALLFRGKSSKYYDPATAAMKEREFKAEVEKMKLNDDNLYPKDWQWDYGKWDFHPSAVWLQQHAPLEGWG